MGPSAGVAPRAIPHRSAARESEGRCKHRPSSAHWGCAEHNPSATSRLPAELGRDQSVDELLGGGAPTGAAVVARARLVRAVVAFGHVAEELGLLVQLALHRSHRLLAEGG